MAYFNNAATTYPKPIEVYDYMNEYYRQNGDSSGRGSNNIERSEENLLSETRSLICDLLHCSNKQVIFQPTATIAINIIIQGLIKKGAKNIYISPFEHNAVTRTLHYFEEKKEINVEQLIVNERYVFDLERIRYQFDRVNPDLVIVSHASNVNGLIAPVEDIFTLAKKYNAYTLVDMAQTAGLIDCNIGLEIYDFAVFAGHKTLYGPTGISGFVMNRSIDLPACFFGGTGYDSANQNMPDSLPEKYEFGTMNMIGLAGLNAALKWINKISTNEIRKIEKKNREKVIQILNKYWFVKIVGNYDSCDYVGIVSCLIEGISSDIAGKLFDKCGISVRTGLQCAPLAHQFMKTYPSGTIRLSVSYFISDKDFDDLDKALEYIEENI